MTREAGDPWVYARVGVRDGAGADRVLVEAVRPLFLAARRTGLADRGFYIRYVDEIGPHLRVRLRADPRSQPSRLRELFERHLGGALAFAAYEPETESYGGPAGVALAEDAFDAGSRAALAVLDACARERPVTVPAAALLLWDGALHGLGLGHAARGALLGQVALAGGAGSEEVAREVDRRFAARREALEALVGPRASPLFLDRCAGCPRLEHATLRYRRRLARIGAALRTAARARLLTRPIDHFAMRFLHLDANRLGLDRTEETVLAALAARAIAP